MKHITVGVAGHIDHGKTALVRALTGTETDRLKEEQERGMSIVLGFASLGLPGGEIDLIDVPGHEKFVKTMIAGATGIEAVLLVIAANEIIKPQTVEHVALAGLLGVRRGLVAITKSDLAPDEDERELIEDEIGTFLQDTFLRDAPRVWVSAITGEGLETLRTGLETLLDQAAPAARPFFFLPIDRVFTIVGHGTVVTGTLRRGPLCLGQGVQILPGGSRAEIRGLEVHNRPVTRVEPGWRAAVNLRGVRKEDLQPGDALATPDVLRATRLLDAELRLLPSAARPFRRGQTLRLYAGTAEVSVRVYPLERDELAPGETALVQFRLERDMAVPVREPFVVRTWSPAETVGGGLIIDVCPLRHTRRSPDIARRVAVLAQGSDRDRLREKLAEAGPAGRDVQRLAADLDLAPEEMDRALAGLPLVRCPGGLLINSEVFDDLGRRVLDQIRAFHAAHPTLPGMPREELRGKLPPDLKPAAFGRLLETLDESGRLRAENGAVKEPAWTAGRDLSALEQEIARQIEDGFRQGGLRPPNLEDVLGQDRRRKNLYQFLVKTGVLVPAVDRTSNRTVVFHRDALARAERLLEQRLGPGVGRTVSELNALLEITRKYAIPLLEYLDARGVTRREGDLRFWNGGRNDRGGR